MKTIGIAGGGQLGRMLAEAAHVLGYRVVVLDPTPNSPAAQVADEHIVGDYKDAAMMQKLAAASDVVTFEVESVNAQALIDIHRSGKSVHPTPHTLAIIKDKLAQKKFLAERGIPVADFAAVSSLEMAKEAGKQLGYPYVLKARSGGFDGRGNYLIASENDIAQGVKNIFGDAYTEISAYAEKFVPFDKELAIVAARTTTGDISVFPLVETVHRDHICVKTMMPADVSAAIVQQAHRLAEKVLAAFEGAGVFGIEMFQIGEKLVINEIAPRVHNSGHWTIEGCETSQFEQHIRAITDMPLGSVDLKAPASVMINILGERNGRAEPKGVEDAERLGDVKVHIYGKIETRVKRKMGHITALGTSIHNAKAKAEKARSLVTI